MKRCLKHFRSGWTFEAYMKKSRKFENISTNEAHEEDATLITGNQNVQHLCLPFGDLLGFLSGERRWQRARLEAGDVSLHGLHHAVTVQTPGSAGYGLGADLDGVLRHGGLVPEQLGVLGEQVQHVVVDVVHAHLLPHEPAALLADELRLRRVLVAPVHGGFDGLADVVSVNRQVVLAGDERPGQNVLEDRSDEQNRRVACQDVLLAHRPRVPFYVNLVPASINIQVI